MLTQGWRVLVDLTRTRQALFNLTSNAVKHTPPDAAIHVRPWTDDGTATIEIADEGHGVTAAVADRIFEPRVRGSDTSGGLGLGLYVARRIAEGHGGTLELVPAEHRGASFRLTLPIGPERPDLSRIRSSTPSHAAVRACPEVSCG